MKKVLNGKGITATGKTGKAGNFGSEIITAAAGTVLVGAAIHEASECYKCSRDAKVKEAAANALKAHAEVMAKIINHAEDQKTERTEIRWKGAGEIAKSFADGILKK